MELETILFFSYIPFCAVGLFYLFHCDWDAMLFSYGRLDFWLGFNFDDVKMTAFKILCAILISIPLAAVLTVAWPIVVAALAISVPSYGGALLLRKLSKRKKLDGSTRK